MLKKLLLLFSLLFVIAASLFGMSSCSDKSWRSGVLTTLSVSIVAENGVVSGVVRNDFTLGFATVKAYVYLYTSDKYTTNVEEMQEVANNFTEDLNIFSELKVSAPIQKDVSYWRAKLVYREDNKHWTEAYTKVCTVDSHGGISL